MPYCIRCGVRLEDTAPGCPLCGTAVPETFRTPAEHIFPPDELSETRKVRVPSRAAAGITTLLLCIPFGITLVTDLAVNGRVSWSYYPMISLVFFWLTLIRPFLIFRRIPQIILENLLAAAAFLLLLDIWNPPVIWSGYPAAALICIALGMMIFRHSRSGYVRIILTSVLLQGFLMTFEALLSRTAPMTWSVAVALPLVLCTAAGALVICFFLRRIAANPAWSTGLFTLSMILLFSAVLLMLLELVLMLQDGARLIGWSLFAAVPLMLMSFIVLHGAKHPHIHQALKRRFHL